MSTPRVNTAPTVWTPYLRKPVRVAFSSTLTQLYQRFSCVWWAKPSNWVPTWPISEMTISSFEPRREGALNVHVEAARAEERHLVAEHVAELDHLAGLDELRRVHHRRGGLAVHRAALVGRPPLRRAALARIRRRPGRRLSKGGGRGEQQRPAEGGGKRFHGRPSRLPALAAG